MKAIASFSSRTQNTLADIFLADNRPVEITNPYLSYKRAAIWAAGEILSALQTSDDADDKKLLEFIQSQRQYSAEQVFIIGKCPIDKPADLLPVPHGSTTQHYANNAADRGKKTFVCEYSLIGLNWLLRNAPFAHPLEHGGSVFHHVSPRKATAAKAASVGGAKFGHHVENPYEDDAHSIDVFSLLALRNQQTPTSFATEAQIWEVLNSKFTEAERGLLKSTEGGGRFKLVSGASQTGRTENIFPLIVYEPSGDFKKFRIQTEPDRIFVAYPNASDANAVQAVINKLRLEFLSIGSKHVLSPGQMLFLDNRRCTHGREALHLLDNSPDNLMDMRQLIRLWNKVLRKEWSFQDAKNFVR